MKPMLSNNLFNSEKTIVIENEMITDDKEIVEVLHFFINLTETFNVPQTNHSNLNFENVRDL